MKVAMKMNKIISKWMSLAALKEEMTIKEQFLKWISFLALMAFVAAVFMIVDGCYWLGIILIGAGAGFASLAAKKKANETGRKTTIDQGYQRKVALWC